MAKTVVCISKGEFVSWEGGNDDEHVCGIPFLLPCMAEHCYSLWLMGDAVHSCIHKPITSFFRIGQLSYVESIWLSKFDLLSFFMTLATILLSHVLASLVQMLQRLVVGLLVVRCSRWMITACMNFWTKLYDAGCVLI